MSERDCERRRGFESEAYVTNGTAHPERRSSEGGGGEGNGKNFFAPGGQRNPLKRLDPDKEIKGNPSPFL
jgi:hypothetical protein